MELQPAGRPAAALQELSRQQLQKPGNDTEQTPKAGTVNVSAATARQRRRAFMRYLLSQFLLCSISKVCLNMKRTSCERGEQHQQKRHKLMTKLTPVSSQKALVSESQGQ